MSKGTQQQFKQFNIDKIQNACAALGNLICGVIINLEKYKEYSLEAESLLANFNTELVPAKDYENINDKLLYRQHEMLKLVADDQNNVFSYYKLRSDLKKRKFLSKPLTKEMNDLLDELLNVRKWTFHNPQSMMVAAKEVTEKSIPEELKSYIQITPQLNPVIVRMVDSYELMMLESLVIHTQKRIKQFEDILQNMKADYQEMFDSIDLKPILITKGGLSSEVQYILQHTSMGFIDYSNDVSQISMAIQKSKYNGTDEEFNKWIIRLNNTTEDE